MALVALASVVLGGSPACEKCEDRPGMGGFSITAENFRAGSVAAGNATTYAEWLTDMSRLSCEDACDRLVSVSPITVTSCSTARPDGGSEPLGFLCEWVHHSCDSNPGCTG